VPATGPAQATRFSDLFLRNSVVTPVNLEGTTLTLRVYAPGATSGTLDVFVSDTASGFGPSHPTDLASLSQKWTDITISIGGSASVKTDAVRQVNLLVTTGSAGSSVPTVVYVVSIRTSNLDVNETFDSSYGGFVKSGLVVVAGSTLAWSPSVP
jgi:hypothetical protein